MELIPHVKLYTSENLERKLIMECISASVVLGYRARLEIQGLRVQTRLRSMDFFSGRKNPEHKSSGL